MIRWFDNNGIAANLLMIAILSAGVHAAFDEDGVFQSADSHESNLHTTQPLHDRSDGGQAQHFSVPFPCHHLMHGRGRFGLPALTNLDKLPPQVADRLADGFEGRFGRRPPVWAVAAADGAALVPV